MTTKESYGKTGAGTCKAVGLALALVVMIGFLMLPSLSSLTGQRSQPRKPSAFGAASPVASTVPLPSAGELLGKWEAQATLRDRGVCTEKLELRQGGQGTFVGYSSLLCINLNPYMGGPKPDYRGAALAALDRYNPVASVLSGGGWDNGSINFRVEKSLGANPAEGRCATTAFKITPFGMGQVVSEWQDGPCGGGQLLLKKTGL